MIRVKIPATSANLGSGFDSLGIALTLYNEVYMEESDKIEIFSRDGLEVPCDASNLIYQSASRLYEACGKKLVGMHIEQISNIPLTRGLGSSSACIVGGLIGANDLLGNPVPTEEIVRMAAQMEGHPDNATPAILGGFVSAVLEEGHVTYVKQELCKEDLIFATFIPDFELSTEVARAALPKMVSHKDAVYNLSRAALLSISLFERKYENLRVATKDRLHQPYRLQYIPGAQEVFDLSERLGAYASFISGAGSTLISIVDSKRKESFYHRANEGLMQMGLKGWKLLMLEIDNVGTQFSMRIHNDFIGDYIIWYISQLEGRQ